MANTNKDFDFSQLNAAERHRLAQDLWESIHHQTQALPLPAEQLAEIRRRIDAIDAGTIPNYPWEDVKRRLLSRK
jgi:putative addiction module component (TIGR02574 family)